MVNTFNQYHLQRIAYALNDEGCDVLVRRSRVYTKAVVIGKPGVPGSMMLSFIQQTPENPDRSGWLVSLYPDHHPKEVADGEVKRQGFTTDETFLYWGDMLRFVVSTAKGLSPAVI